LRGRSISSCERLEGRNGFIEYYRADASGRIAEAPAHLTSRYGGGYNPNDNPFAGLFNFFERGPFGGGPSGGPRDSIRTRAPNDGFRPSAPVPNASNQPPPPSQRPRPVFFDQFSASFPITLCFGAGEMRQCCHMVTRNADVLMRERTR
jgi:hypothetical protein